MPIKNLGPLNFKVLPHLLSGSNSRKGHVVVLKLAAAVQICAESDQNIPFADDAIRPEQLPIVEAASQSPAAPFTKASIAADSGPIFCSSALMALA